MMSKVVIAACFLMMLCGVLYLYVCVLADEEWAKKWWDIFRKGGRDD